MADTLLFQAPDFQQVLASTLVAASPSFEALQQTIADMQAQIADLTARVAALEAAAAP